MNESRFIEYFTDLVRIKDKYPGCACDVYVFAIPIVSEYCTWTNLRVGPPTFTHIPSNQNLIGRHILQCVLVTA